MATRTVFTGKTLGQLWKQGWSEIPEVMGSSVFYVLGVIAVPCYLYYYEKNDVGNHRFKHKYVIYRPDDPRVERIRKFPDSPATTRWTGTC